MNPFTVAMREKKTFSGKKTKNRTKETMTRIPPPPPIEWPERDHVMKMVIQNGGYFFLVKRQSRIVAKIQ